MIHNEVISPRTIQHSLLASAELKDLAAPPQLAMLTALMAS
jgi:hypothetical protein